VIETLSGHPANEINVIFLVDRDGHPVEPFMGSVEQEALKEIVEEVVRPYIEAEPTQGWVKAEARTEIKQKNYRGAVRVWESADPSHRVLRTTTIA
jgi:thioredoxin-like negative regulator of GroEL